MKPFTFLELLDNILYIPGSHDHRRPAWSETHMARSLGLHDSVRVMASVFACRALWCRRVGLHDLPGATGSNIKGSLQASFRHSLTPPFNRHPFESSHTSGNVHAARERPCDITREYDCIRYSALGRLFSRFL